MRLEVGAQFANYTVISRLGRGGMATVYLVREPGLDRLVALKVLPEHLVDEFRFADRFQQEAQVIAGLDHPNIIPLYRCGITDDMPWMALRYVDGGDLASRMLAQELAFTEGFAILRGVAAALDYAHRNGVIHRDLKPQNILLTRDHAPYLADFGIAKLLESSAKLKTATGGLLGTPAYMAPEQARGHPLGPGTDIYALAVICFRWLTGSLPFDADTPHAILIKHVMEPLPLDLLESVSPAIVAVLQRGLAKLPTERYATAGALISELEGAVYRPTPVVAPMLRPIPTENALPPTLVALPPDASRPGSPHTAADDSSAPDAALLTMAQVRARARGATMESRADLRDRRWTRISCVVMLLSMIVLIPSAIDWLRGFREPIPRGVANMTLSQERDSRAPPPLRTSREPAPATGPSQPPPTDARADAAVDDVDSRTAALRANRTSRPEPTPTRTRPVRAISPRRSAVNAPADERAPLPSVALVMPEAETRETNTVAIAPIEKPAISDPPALAPIAEVTSDSPRVQPAITLAAGSNRVCRSSCEQDEVACTKATRVAARSDDLFATCMGEGTDSKYACELRGKYGRQETQYRAQCNARCSSLCASSG